MAKKSHTILREAYMIVFAVYINETLVCRRKLGKLEDPYAVAVFKDHDIVVGHIPRKISMMCSIF